MKIITFEDKQYKPFDLVLHLLSEFPTHKVDPRIKPLLDKEGLMKDELLAAIKENLPQFRVVVAPIIDSQSGKLVLTESSNLLAHLFCAQRKFGGVKPFGKTKSSAKLQALIMKGVVNEVDVSAPASMVLNQDASVSVVAQPDEFSLIVSRLKDNPNRDCARLDELIEVLKLMKARGINYREGRVRGWRDMAPFKASEDYEQDSLMAYLMEHLQALEKDYGAESVTRLLMQLPSLVLIDIKDHYESISAENDTPVTSMMKRIESFGSLTEMASVIELSGESNVANAEKKALSAALNVSIQQWPDDAYLALLKLTESRKAAIALFLKIKPESQRMAEAKAVIKHWFGGKSMNAPLFCREIKKLLQQERHVDAIRLCAAADRRSFVRALLLSDKSVVNMLKTEYDQYITLFSDKIKRDVMLNLKSSEVFSQEIALAARPKTVKLADWLGLFPVSATAQENANGRGQERLANEAQGKVSHSLGIKKLT
ncbi:MAG TPA: hypothetical protein VFU82_04870 [Gammaproteobacteria bacterium]|nr:hypothetical protein [Gammaproteobacteria bacterium]